MPVAQTLATIFGALAAIVGAIVGGATTVWAQARIQRRTFEIEVTRDKQAACIEFLTAIRSFRRFVMYTTQAFEVVAPDDKSKGAVVIEGRSAYDQRLDEALSRLMIVVPSEPVIRAAFGRSHDLNEFLRERATAGRGRVPNERIHELLRREREFASLAVSEISGLEVAVAEWASGDKESAS